MAGPTCRDMAELVTNYLERALTWRARSQAWLHLLRCEACRRYFDQVRRTVGLLGVEPGGETPVSEARRIATEARHRAAGEPET
jgi:predicted anti-sigma-YlaC factor YlaD